MALCPSRNTRMRLGSFIAPMHRIWEWRWDEGSGYLCQSNNDGNTEDVFLAEKKLTGSTIWRHGHPRGTGPSAQWSPHTRGRSKAVGE